MPLNLPQSFEEGFVTLIERLRNKLPAELFHLEGIAEEQLDIDKASRAFFAGNKADGKKKAAADASIDANANVTGRDTITFNYEVPKPLMKLNSLHNLWKGARELYGEDFADGVIEAELVGMMYINDAWDIGRPYCFNYSAYDIALNGLSLSARLNIAPPKSLATFLRQVEQFIVHAANSNLGATGMADLLLVASLYVDKILEGTADRRYYYDNHVCVGTSAKEVWDYVSESLTSLIYTLNWEFRGHQSPFTNVSVYDRCFLEKLLPGYQIEGRTPSMATVEQMQEVFLDCYNAALSRDPITFPVVTACFSVSKDKGGEGERKLCDLHFLDLMAAKNLPYAAFNFYLGESYTLSSCCRLRSDGEGLGYANSFGAGSTKIGSIGVVTLNLPALASAAADVAGVDDSDSFAAFCELVSVMTEAAAKVNHVKRLFIRDRIGRGSLPLYSQGFMDLKRQYSTCGFTGLYEALETLGFDIREAHGLAAARRVLGVINSTNSLMQNVLGTPHNMEQTPAETSAVKLARKDKIMGMQNKPCHLYSNQFLPLGLEGTDLLDRIRIQGALDSCCTGGAICHLNIGEALHKPEAMKALVLHAASEGVVYFAINYVLNRCAGGHITVGVSPASCPVCGAEITGTYTRVVGFLSNVEKWNKTRREEDWPARIFYSKQERVKETAAEEGEMKYAIFNNRQ